MVTVMVIVVMVIVVMVIVVMVNNAILLTTNIHAQFSSEINTTTLF